MPMKSVNLLTTVSWDEYHTWEAPTAHKHWLKEKKKKKSIFQEIYMTVFILKIWITVKKLISGGSLQTSLWFCLETD